MKLHHRQCEYLNKKQERFVLEASHVASKAMTRGQAAVLGALLGVINSYLCWNSKVLWSSGHKPLC